MKMRYNVLWIDDDYKKQEDFIGYAEQENINIIPYESHEEGILELNNRLDYYHAVVLDAKVKKFKQDTVTGLEGLTASRDRLIELNNSIYLPFFIFTGQPDYVDLDWFKQAYGQYYIKGKDNDALLKAIIHKVDKKEEFVVRRDYKDAFEACEKYLGKENQKVLLEILKAIGKPREKFNDLIYFTQLRLIVELIFRKALQMGLLHEKCISGGEVNLSESCLYLSGKDTKYLNVKCSRSHFPRILGDNVWKIISITGAASHTDDELVKTAKVSLTEYRGLVNTPYLLYSLSFMAVDLLLWFGRYAEQNNNIEENKKHWRPIVPVTIEDWTEGKIVRIVDGYGTFVASKSKEEWTIVPHKLKEFDLKLHQILRVQGKKNSKGKMILSDFRV